MDDAEGVRVGQGQAGLQDEIHCLLDGGGPAFLEPCGQVPAFEVLHDEVRGAARQSAHVVDAHHMLAGDPCSGPCLTGETRDGLGVCHHLGEQDLDGDSRLEIDVPCCDDGPHAPHAEEAFDLVLAGEDLPGDDAQLRLPDRQRAASSLRARAREPALIMGVKAPATQWFG